MKIATEDGKIYAWFSRTEIDPTHIYVELPIGGYLDDELPGWTFNMRTMVEDMISLCEGGGRKN